MSKPLYEVELDELGEPGQRTSIFFKEMSTGSVELHRLATIVECRLIVRFEITVKRSKYLGYETTSILKNKHILEQPHNAKIYQLDLARQMVNKIIYEIEQDDAFLGIVRRLDGTYVPTQKV